MEHTIDAHRNGESRDLTIREAHASGALRCAERIVGVLPTGGHADPHLRSTLEQLGREGQGSAPAVPPSLGLVVPTEQDGPNAHTWLVPVLELAGELGHVALIDATAEQRLTAAFGLNGCAGLEQVAHGVTALADVMYDVEGHDHLVVIGRGSPGSVGSVTVEGPIILGALRSAGYHVMSHVDTTPEHDVLDVFAGIDALLVVVSSTEGSALDLDRVVDGLVSQHGLPVGLVVSGLDANVLADDPLVRLSGAALTRERATRNTQDVAEAISSAWDPADLHRATGALTAVVPDELQGLTGRTTES